MIANGASWWPKAWPKACAEGARRRRPLSHQNVAFAQGLCQAIGRMPRGITAMSESSAWQQGHTRALMGMPKGRTSAQAATSSEQARSQSTSSTRRLSSPPSRSLYTRAAPWRVECAATRSLPSPASPARHMDSVRIPRESHSPWPRAHPEHPYPPPARGCAISDLLCTKILPRTSYGPGRSPDPTDSPTQENEHR